jgi:hypothetical protein
MKTVIIAILLIVFSSPIYLNKTLSGVWKYQGGIYNGKAEGEPEGYTLQRRYNASYYEAYLIEKGVKPEKYEAGYYTLNTDTCLETETYSSQPSKLIGKTVHYLYSVRNDTLTLKGTLPSGMRVTEYWKKVK